MGNNTSKQFDYLQYYDNINSKNYKYQDIDFNSLDPYKVLNVPKNFTWEQLKNSYKNLAIKTHPDKETGNEVIFKFITKCFKFLALEYKQREQDKSHQILKDQYKNYFNSLNNNDLPHPSNIFNKDEQPFHKKFNKTFEECKVYDEDTEFGYGDLMEKSNDKREDIKINNIFSKNKVDNSKFNEVFNKSIPVSKQLTKYNEPQALLLVKNMQYTELGKAKTDDYSSSIENKNNLPYTDYMKAYSGENFINPDNINNKKNFKNIEEYKKYSNNLIKKGLTDKELKKINKKKIEEEKKELDRLERLNKHDKNIQISYEKASRLFIK